MATKKQPTTGEALAAGRQAVAAARVNDPGEHYPYKASVVADLLDTNPAMDPGDGSDVTAVDFMSQRIAQASEAYIAAQEQWLLDPTPANNSRYEAAKDDLVAARRNHRRNRVDADGKPAGAIVALTNAPMPDGLVGPRARRIGE